MPGDLRKPAVHRRSNECTDKRSHHRDTFGGSVGDAVCCADRRPHSDADTRTDGVANGDSYDVAYRLAIRNANSSSNRNAD